MARTGTFIVLTLLFCPSWLLAEQSVAKQRSEAELKAEIKKLKAERKTAYKVIDAKYDPILSKIGKPEDKLEAEGTRLKREEAAALKDISDATDRAKVKAEYDQLRKNLKEEVKEMESQMTQIGNQEKAEKALVKSKFNPAINALISELKALQKIK
jgi:hypothetical protein